MSTLLEGLKQGLELGSIFALMALGYSMVYGIVKMINFAHSEFITIGGFVAYFITESLLSSVMKDSVWSLIIALVFAIIVCVITAILTERFAYRPLRQKGSSRITALITAIGVSYILSGIMNAIEPNEKSFHAFVDQDTSFYIAIITTAVLLVLLTLFVKKTKIGIAMRAVSENEQAAKLMGINNNFIVALTFIIGSALAAIGVVIYLIDGGTLSFELGSVTIGLYPFVAAVIGGIGSLPGAVIGGFLIGIIKAITQTYGNLGLSPFTDTIIYGIFVIILLFKPSGLLGKDTKEKV
ncbi:MAG: branched-chain amino acid ABC transporter permease [Bacilli bacterium]|jgi:branched-chain amino acid transport system permease protein|nr:branched-chain amino acid ABC transporter permease [Bacilli bacterium]